MARYGLTARGAHDSANFVAKRTLHTSIIHYQTGTVKPIALIRYLAIAQARIAHARQAQPGAIQAALLTEGVA
jgi:hypothetical protein